MDEGFDSEDIRATLFVLLVQLPGLGVLEADEVARWLMEEATASRWWSWEC